MVPKRTLDTTDIRASNVRILNAATSLMSDLLQDSNSKLPYYARLGSIAAEHYQLLFNTERLTNDVVDSNKETTILGGARKFLDKYSHNTTRSGINQTKERLWDITYFVYDDYFDGIQEVNQRIRSQSMDVELLNPERGFSTNYGNYPNHINVTLHELMYKRLQCACKWLGSREFPALHQCALQLNTSDQVVKDKVSFDVMWSKVLKAKHESKPHWQSLRLDILRDSPSNQLLHDTILVMDQGEKVELCKFLDKDIGSVTMRLELDNNQLLRAGRPEHHSYAVKEPTRSLLDIRKAQNLSCVMRIDLAWIFARSLWQYYASDITSTPWLSDNICYINSLGSSDKSGEAGSFNLALPFLILEASASARSSKEILSDSDYVYNYPRILNLGILLVELGLSPEDDIEIEKAITGKHPRWLNNMYGTFVEKSKDSMWPSFDMIDPHAAKIYREVTQKCFDIKLFTQATTAQTRKRILFESIVAPLELLLHDMQRTDSAGNDTGNTYAKIFVDPETQEPELVTTRYEPIFMDQYIQSAAKNSEKWIEEIQKLSCLMQMGEMFDENGWRKTKQFTRIRIAVLDTGYDPGSKFFDDDAKRARIRGWKDCAGNEEEEEEEDALDEDGHGTNVVSLVMKVAPMADIYVARISRGREVESGGVRVITSVASAIKWAESVGVDIVSMSFGWNQDDSNILWPIGNAIAEAVNKRMAQPDKHQAGILFFAAAGNDGLNSPESFPATHEFVTPIRATDVRGAFNDFNPNSSDKNVFGTLGCSIPAVLTRNMPSVEKSIDGSSLATPIAAGIAADALASARLRFDPQLSAPEINQLDRLWRRRGMEQMFFELSESHGGGRHYLSMKKIVSRGGRLADLNMLINIACNR